MDPYEVRYQKILYKKIFVVVFAMVAYYCRYLSDNYVDMSDLYVDLSVINVILSDKIITTKNLIFGFIA